MFRSLSQVPNFEEDAPIKKSSRRKRKLKKVSGKKSKIRKIEPQLTLADDDDDGDGDLRDEDLDDDFELNGDDLDQLSKLFSCSACSKSFDKKKSYVYHLKKGRCPGRPEPKKLHKVSS